MLEELGEQIDERRLEIIVGREVHDSPAGVPRDLRWRVAEWEALLGKQAPFGLVRLVQLGKLAILRYVAREVLEAVPIEAREGVPVRAFQVGFLYASPRRQKRRTSSGISSWNCFASASIAASLAGSRWLALEVSIPSTSAAR